MWHNRNWNLRGFPRRSCSTEVAPAASEMVMMLLHTQEFLVCLNKTDL
jgi:hypothetical protein